jgi:hypothetical protein
MNKALTFDHTIKYLEFIIGFIKSKIDEEWLNKQLQIINSYKPKSPSKITFNDYVQTHFHPLAYLIYQVNKQLSKTYENKFLEVTEEILKLTFIGESLYILSLNKATNLDKKIKELMSRDKNIFDKTCYEIQVAAKFSNLGHRIEFIDTKSDECLKTPDLLISDNVEVECKKKDVFSNRDTKNINRWQEIMRNASTLMDKYNYNYIVYVNTIEDLQSSDIQFIIKKLEDLIKDKLTGNFFYEEVGITINLSFLSEAMQEFQTNLFQVNVGEEYDYATQTMQVTAVDDKNVKIRNPRFFAFKSKIIPDRIQSVIESIKQATQQLTGTKPGLIYVNLNQLDSNLVEADFIRLDNLVKDRLRQNSTITAIILTSEIFQKDKSGIKYLHKAKVIRNINSKFSLPTNFTIFGDN